MQSKKSNISIIFFKIILILCNTALLVSFVGMVYFLTLQNEQQSNNWAIISYYMLAADTILYSLYIIMIKVDETKKL